MDSHAIQLSSSSTHSRKAEHVIQDVEITNSLTRREAEHSDGGTLINRRTMVKIGEQAVLVYLRLSDDSFGDYDERESIFDLEERIASAIRLNNAGEYDGHELGNGWATLYSYGPDALYLANVIIPILRLFAPRDGSHVITRFGRPGAREERVSL